MLLLCVTPSSLTSDLCLVVDLGSDDQQVPVFSEQLLWNPY